MQRSPPYRLGVDVGGTFTDLFLLDEGSGDTWRAKVPSTPSDQSLAVLSGVEEILSKTPNASDVVLHVVNHGTTVGTNAILEQKGAKVALVVTEGYRDILQIRRSQVPGGLASWITWKKPEPLAPLEMTVEAPGRLATDGSEVRTFDESALEERLQKLVGKELDAVTICLINSFANPAHELAARRVVCKIFPETPVSISSEVLSEIMEYERTITTVVNSYIEPAVAKYLDRLLHALQERAKHLRILRSDGGLSSIKLAKRFPVTWMLSGPAGGVSGVVSVVAEQTRFKNLITLDMGGTSTDVSLIENCAPRTRRETKVGDLVVRAPSVDVRTVGAGGGSIARVPEVTKALRVGPESASAVPGPACYRKGGDAATVTDANAVLGYLPRHLLNGSFEIDLDAAKKVVQQVADDLNVGLYEAAEGILKVSNETMYGALRLVSIEQGYDPKDFSLVAFGGAGPLHANALGVLMDSFPVIVPPSPGVLCALGEATTTLRHEISRPFMGVLEKTSKEDILNGYRLLLKEAVDVMCDAQGVLESKQSVLRLSDVRWQEHYFQADLRYQGQAHNVSVNLSLDALKRDGPSAIRDLFEAEHKRLFTYHLQSPVELMNLRIIVEEKKSKLPIRKLLKALSPNPPTSSIASFSTLIFSGSEYRECAVWTRSTLQSGHRLQGPCIITEMDSNTVVRPGFIAEIDDMGNILISPVSESSPSSLTMGKNPHEILDLDPATVDIFEHALRNARNEMDTLMTRTTMSPAIREQQDEFNVIAEPSGKMIVGQFGSFIGDFLDSWKGTIEEGDVFLTNDPYSVAGAISHHPDWLILMPIFANEKIIAWTANFGHMTDVGGSVPGSLPTGACSIFEEGIQIPVTKAASKGDWNQDLMDLIYRNVRLPEWNRCDVQALVAACTLAGQRMVDLYKRFGDKTYFATIEELLERNKRAVSSIIATAIPDEPVFFEDWIDDDGQGVGPWKIACTMSRENGRLMFDFSETDPQSPSSINFYLSINMDISSRRVVSINLPPHPASVDNDRTLSSDPSVVANDGFHSLMDVHIPEGSLLRPIRPAALSCRTHFLGRLLDLISGLLGQKAPEFMTAAGFSDSPHFMYSGYKDSGEWFQLYWLGFGGIPARPHGDGPDAHSLWPAMKSIPNEFLELYYPLCIETYATLPDSGGPGLYRGGNAQFIRWRFLSEGEISIHDDRWLSKPWGVLGGEPGQRSSKVLARVDGGREILGSKQDRIRVRKGDVLEWSTWGGGGWGNALHREPETVGLEIRRGLVSTKGAERYGVVVDKEGKVDAEGTKLLRSQMERQELGTRKEETKIFNRGGTWEELKEKCFEETGLAPPKDPREVELRGPMTRTKFYSAWKCRQR
ncbi:MAG: hypothetical protein Q9167_002789 [Letrouitia subvulpina]